jgi:hypothetical protein
MTECAKTNSQISAQSNFRKLILKDTPPRQSKYKGFEKYENQECICKKKIVAHSYQSEEDIG